MADAHDDYNADYHGYNASDGNGTVSQNETGNISLTTRVYSHDPPDYVYDEFIYPGFAFERHIYLVLWECLVIWTLLFNIIVVMIFLRRKLRNPTNIILVFIAVSDSLTGLVTLPTYIHVYQYFGPGQNHGASGGDNFDDYTDDYKPFGSPIAPGNSSDVNSGMHYYTDPYTDESVELTSQSDFYTLTKGWCQAFMISKFFVSKAFHTISIWLTLFLGVQRYVSVRFPFKSQQMFTTRNTLLFILLIYIISPWLHVYHLLDEKARDSTGMCEWTLERDCGGGCAYMWLVFLLMHFIPCVLLAMFTILMIFRLYKSTAVSRHSMNREKVIDRNGANRRITIIVSTIVIVFLIPELPYGVFLLYSVSRRHAGLNIMTLENNRAFHAAYELLLVTTFHANFWIYTGLNRRFRFELLKTFAFALGPVYHAIGASFRRSFRTVSLSLSSTKSTGRTNQTDLHTKAVAMEMKPLQDGPQTAPQRAQPHDHEASAAKMAPLKDDGSIT